MLQMKEISKEKMRKRVIAIILSMGMCVSLTACQKETAEAEVICVPVEVAAPEQGEVIVTSTYMGSVSPEEEVMVYPMVSGTVTEVNFKVGDQVKAGDVLFRVDDTAARLQLDSANASYSTAAANISMAEGSSRELQNAQTEAQIDSLRAQRSTYRETYDNAEEQLNNLNGQMASLNAAADAAQKVYGAARAEYEASKAAYEAALQTELTDPTVSEADKNSSGTSTDASQLNILKEQMELKKLEMEQAQAAVEQAAVAVGNAQASAAQLEAAKKQADAAYDQINDSVQAAKEAYSITKDKLYVQQDAANDAQLSAAALGIQSAKTQLSYYTIEAPVGGMIESISVEKNGMASPGYPAYIISNKENMVVTFHVTEAAAKELQIGDGIEAERDGACYPGRITEIGTMANAQTRLFMVKASLGPANELSTGVNVKVKAESRKASDVMKVPYDALYFRNGKSYLYCVEDGKAVMTAVATGLMNDMEVEITEGIDRDSLVITTWSSQLEDGVNVAIKGTGEAAKGGETE